MSKSFANDLPTVEAMLKDPRLQPVFDEAKQRQWDGFLKHNGGWGGGNSIRRFANDRPILLDLFTADSTFQDHSFDHKPLIETEAMKFSGMESMKVQNLSAYHSAKKILETWSAKNKGLVDLISLAMDNLTVNYVWRGVPLASPNTYSLPQSLASQFPQGVLTPCVAYHKRYGLIISAPEWNQLGDLSQSALLIHEAVRRIQLSYSLTVSQEKLQRLTATIVLKSPLDKINLESTDFLDQKLLEEIRRVSTWQIAPKSSHDNLCRLEARNILGTKSSFLAWYSPKEKLEQYCKTIPKFINFGKTSLSSGFQLNARMVEFNKNYCQQNLAKRTDYSLLALEAWLNLKLQYSEIFERVSVAQNERPSLSSLQTEILDLEHEITLFRMSLPAALASTLTPPAAVQAWEKWRQKHCDSGQTITSSGFQSALKILLAANSDQNAVINEAADAYISLFQNAPKQSLPQIIENLIAQRLAEEEAKNNYKDTFWEQTIINHINGRVLNPEFLRILQGLKATEEYLRRNIPTESLRF